MSLKIEKVEDCIFEGLQTTQTINRNLLLNIIDCDQLQTVKYNEIYENEKQFLIALYNLLDKKGEIKVEYDYPKGWQYGRVYANKSMSLACVRRELRHRLCMDNYIDIDIENCHPVLLLQQLKQNKLDCPYLGEYVNNRDKHLTGLMNTFKIDRTEAKKNFLSIMYGGQPKYENEFSIQFKKELDRLTKIIMKFNPDLVKECKTKKIEKGKTGNLAGSFLSMYCQEMEKVVLLQMYNYLKINSIIDNNVVLCFDGCMIPKQILPELFLENMADYVLKNSGFVVKLVFKAFDQPLIIDIVDLVVNVEIPDKIVDIHSLYCTSLTGTDYDIANFFFQMNKNLFVCAQETPRPIWYMFEKGLWIRLEGVSTIRKYVESSLLEYYETEIAKLKKTDKKTKQSIVEYNSELINMIQSIVKNKIKKYKIMTDIVNQLTKFYKDDTFNDKIDSNPEIICFGEDLFDLKSCEWRKTLASDYCTLKCGVTKDELNDTNEDLIKKILLDIFTTEERMNYMINVFSMFLNGKNDAQTFNVWLGAGANGKSLIQDYFMYGFGDYFVDLPSTLITQKEGAPESASPQLCRARGRRCAFFTEPEEGTKANNSLLKKWSGGERITCRALYENPSLYNVFFKIIILCNTKFELQDVQDDSIPRRIVYANFKTKFDYEPKFAFQKLRVDEYKSADVIKTNKGSFMNMLINNYIRLSANNYKFPVPADMVNDQNDFINNNDEIKVFLKSEYTKTDNNEDYIQSKEMFTYFISYCKANNIKVNIKEKTFKDRVMKEIPFKERYQGSVNGKQLNLRSIFTNIKLNCDIDNEDDNLFI